MLVIDNIIVKKIIREAEITNGVALAFGQKIFLKIIKTFQLIITIK